MSNCNKLQAIPNITLRKSTNAPPFVSDLTNHKDPGVKTVGERAAVSHKLFCIRLKYHGNPVIIGLRIPSLRRFRENCVALTNTGNVLLFPASKQVFDHPEWFSVAVIASTVYIIEVILFNVSRTLLNCPAASFHLFLDEMIQLTTHTT